MIFQHPEIKYLSKILKFQNRKIKYPQNFLKSLNKEIKYQRNVIFSDLKIKYTQNLIPLRYDRIDISEGIGVKNTSTSKECIICHYRYLFDKGFMFQMSVCNG